MGPATEGGGEGRMGNNWDGEEIELLLRAKPNKVLDQIETLCGGRMRFFSTTDHKKIYRLSFSDGGFFKIATRVNVGSISDPQGVFVVLNGWVEPQGQGTRLIASVGMGESDWAIYALVTLFASFFVVAMLSTPFGLLPAAVMIYFLFGAWRNVARDEDVSVARERLKSLIESLK